MVCIYCSGSTDITNSRLQKRRNSVWRRRRCQSCGAAFTSIEQASYDLSLSFKDGTSHIVPFQRDTLFLSLYDACKHRQRAAAEAGDLTDTVIHKLLNGNVHDGQVTRTDLIRLVSETLSAFDSAAHVHYNAYHHL